MSRNFAHAGYLGSQTSSCWRCRSPACLRAQSGSLESRERREDAALTADIHDSARGLVRNAVGTLVQRKPNQRQFKARLEVEAGLFVDWRGGPQGLRRASWRAFRALAFARADRGSGPDRAGRATLPRKRSDARIAVN